MQRRLTASVLGFFCVTAALAQSPVPGQIVPADIPDVVKAGAKIELIKSGLMGADDLIAFPDGSVVFGEPNASRVLRLDGQNRITTLVEQTNESRGMSLDAGGRLIAVQAKDGKAKVAVIYPPASETIIADNFDGKPFSRPNDVIVDKKGGIYLTDPGLNGQQAEQLRNAQGGAPLAPRLPPAVYYIPKGGKAVKLADGIERPNGVQLSRDEQTLYVNNTNGEFLIAFDIQPDGTVRNRRNFGRYEGRSKFPNGVSGVQSGADGLAIDNDGRVYCVTAAGIEIFSPQGRRLGTIPVTCSTQGDCQSLAFAGPDKRTLYIAGQGALFKLSMLAQGFTARAK